MKKSSKVLEFLNMGCYLGEVLFCCGHEYEYLIKKLGKKDLLPYKAALQENDVKKSMHESEYLAIRYIMENKKLKKEKLVLIIYLKNRFDFDNDDDYVCLAHEIVHICQLFLPDIMNRDEEKEAEAYLHSHLMRQCIDHLRAKQKPL